MARIEVADRHALPEEFKEGFDIIEKSNGYIPNSYLLLAHRPPILKALMDLSKAVIRDEGTLDRGFRFLIAYMSSRTAGCQFCQAHNISSAARWGITDEKLNAIWEYETSPLFTDAERAAFDLARAASVVPNAATDEIFIRLKKHFTTPQIVEMTAVIALFGWQNRLNDTLQTDLDQHTLDWADQFGLAEKTGWDPTDHIPDNAPKSSKVA
jgi:uncharacterized peroxidase-related enzyme